MEAIILAGGLGTRLRSVVSDLPKCMAPVAGQPFLYYLLKYLGTCHFTHIILSVGYKHEIIEDYISKNNWPFSISYSIENEPLGTGGAIKFAMTKANEDQVLIMNGDTFFEVDLEAYYRFHSQKKADISLALKPLSDFDRYGTVETDKNDKICAFLEKQPCQKGKINGGIYLINRNSSLLNIGKDTFSFETDVLQKCTTNSTIYGFSSSGYFIDIGIPEDFAQANIDFKER